MFLPCLFVANSKKEKKKRQSSHKAGDIVLQEGPPIPVDFVVHAMGVRWNPTGFRLYFNLVLIVIFQTLGCCAINHEGMVLLGFRAGVTYDPYGAFINWDQNDGDPCGWSGVHCEDGVVKILNLTGYNLEGVVAPELGKLSYLRSLILSKNNFYGDIPKDIGDLSELELLDLRDNNLNGTVPSELGRKCFLKCLLLCGNMFEGRIPQEIERLSSLSLLQFDDYLESTMPNGFQRKNIGYCIWQSKSEKQTTHEEPHLSSRSIKNHLYDHGYKTECSDHTIESMEKSIAQNEESVINPLRRKLVEQSINLAAVPVDIKSLPPILNVTINQSSGSFLAVPSKNKTKTTISPPPVGTDNQTATTGGGYDHQLNANGTNNWKCVIIVFVGSTFLIFIVVGMFFICRKRGATNIGPWKTGLSGQLQKAFITGVPKLNRVELETACEDFSNIISNANGCIMYKGTLSSGVEIAVASTVVSSLKEWTNKNEKTYRRKIDTISRVNHKNFVNLLGFCEENDPFTRMMVFEYAPNGTLFEHLHVKEAEHLDWNTRMRIIMGIGYCLQYMHHDINPPIFHNNVHSMGVMLTDDYAAKVAENNLWVGAKSHNGEEDKLDSELPQLIDAETNVYSFGLLLLEIISGKLPHSEEHGDILDWGKQYLEDRRSMTKLIDPSLKSFKNSDLDVICELIQDCTRSNSRERPTMKEVVSRLRGVIPISPDQATPSLSPLWWAELEILSVEAT